MNYELNTYEFTIPTWALCAIVNGDVSGLNEDDIERLTKFENRLIADFGSAFLSLGNEEEQEPTFRWRNDIDGTLGADCITMYLTTKGGKQ